MSRRIHTTVSMDVFDVLGDLTAEEIALGLLEHAGTPTAAFAVIERVHADPKHRRAPWHKEDPAQRERDLMREALDALDGGDVARARHLLACEVLEGASAVEYERARAGKHPFLRVA